MEFVFELVKTGRGACSLYRSPPIPASAELALAPWAIFKEVGKRNAVYTARKTPEGIR
jgi:hypothetical protein